MLFSAMKTIRTQSCNDPGIQDSRILETGIQLPMILETRIVGSWKPGILLAMIQEKTDLIPIYLGHKISHIHHFSTLCCCQGDLC